MASTADDDAELGDEASDDDDDEVSIGRGGCLELYFYARGRCPLPNVRAHGGTHCRKCEVLCRMIWNGRDTYAGVSMCTGDAELGDDASDDDDDKDSIGRSGCMELYCREDTVE